MPKYKLSYTIELWHEIEVEADTMSDATERFHLENMAWSKEAKLTGEYLDERIDVVEIG